MDAPSFRQHVRIAAQDIRAGIRIEDTEEWIPIAIGDISMGGVFAITDRFIVEGTGLDVGLAFPSGIQVVMPTEVARRVEASERGPAGLGLRFINPTGPNLQTLKREVEARLGDHPARDPEPEPEPERPAVLPAHLITELPAGAPAPAPAPAAQTELTGSIYDRLRLAPDVDGQTLAAQFEALLQSVEQQIAQAPARSQQQKNLTMFRQSLARLRPMTRDPLKRAAYDFNHGLVRAEERIRDAEQGRGPKLDALNKAYERVFRDEVREAKALWMKARRGGPEAGPALARALQLDPFNPHIRQMASAQAPPTAPTAPTAPTGESVVDARAMFGVDDDLTGRPDDT